MLGDIVSCCTRIVSRMSTASFEYGFSRLSGIGPGAAAVTRDRSAIASYRNAWWTRISCRWASSASVAGPGASQRMSSRTAGSTSPRNSSQL